MFPIKTELKSWDIRNLPPPPPLPPWALYLSLCISPTPYLLLSSTFLFVYPSQPLYFPPLAFSSYIPLNLSLFPLYCSLTYIFLYLPLFIIPLLYMSLSNPPPLLYISLCSTPLPLAKTMAFLFCFVRHLHLHLLLCETSTSPPPAW